MLLPGVDDKTPEGGLAFPRVYTGGEGDPAALQLVREKQYGILVTAASWRTPKPGIPWMLDCGAFTYWRKGIPFDWRRFNAACKKVPLHHRPDAAFLPDVVMEATASLSLSEAALQIVPHGWPWYLVIQNGMTFEMVEPFARRVAGIGLGGSPPWKVAEGEAWTRWAHERGLKVHGLRFGTFEMLTLAARWGLDSVDSSSWAQNDTYRIIDAARAQRRLEVAHVA